MFKTPRDLLLFSLEELVPYEFEKFKFKLQNVSLESERRRIARGQLQMAQPVKVADLLVSHYGEQCALRLTLHVLRAINQHLLAEELHHALGSDYLESGTDGSTTTCASRDGRPRPARQSDSPEGDGQRQGADGAAGLPTGQPEAGRASQKRPPGKQKDQKGPEGPDAAGKPCTRSLALLRKGPAPGKPQGRALLRRNCSSAGCLTRGNLKPPSGKKRPKSLEIPISSGAAPPNPETPLTQENSDSAPTPSPVAALDGGAALSGGPSSRELGSSQALKGAPPRSRAPAASLAAERTWEHRNATASWERNGMEGPEPPESSGVAAGGGCWAPAGRQQAAGSLGPAPEGDPAGATRARSSSSLGPAPCSPGAPPQCERHMKQALLLFCEDHGEPICLICRLSQEHLGHRVRPLQEAALECKEQVQKQLEHLKGLRESEEQQKAEGEKERANFLKQTAIQKQRVQCHLEGLCHFLKQQEQQFLTKLEELEETVQQVGAAYGARVAGALTLLNGLIGELEARQAQPDWELMQGIGAVLQRAQMMTVPEPWTTPEEVEGKVHLLHQKSSFLEKYIKQFSETLRVEMKSLNVPELTSARAHAAPVTLDPATAHTNLVFSSDLKSVRLGSKSDRLPDSPERFDSCIVTLGVPRFLSGRHYWEVEVGNKTGWILGVCRASTSRKGSITLLPEKGFWVVMMMKRNEYQASTRPPTRLQMKEPPTRVGVFLDHEAGSVSFYNVTAKSHMYTFTGFSSSEALQPVFSPGAHDGGKNLDPLTICAVGGPGPH
ncbi:Pyrin [Galemys pyrenaicus]|uniref:Pyrin n=1 Tax=Galemys pyrenaicus TaxID=202257 RepID=A0A8J6DE55_GALPY|nr:Pyrin [Galemys pyrenaicus]